MRSDSGVVYHGTNLELWEKPHNQLATTSLYLAYDRSIARSYALEKGMTPIVVKFPVVLITNELGKPKPNRLICLEWIEALDSHGVFSVHGMIDQIKHLGTIIPENPTI